MIIKNNDKSICDFILDLGADRKNTEIRLLQITDMQFIDSFQRRSADRLRPDEINAWAPENFDSQCGNQIRSLVAQTNPDLIFITGDIIYGSFDDDGTVFEWFCNFMDSFEIPWAPVFGNHDNESQKGVMWQCERFEKSKYCMFSRGNVSGNGNYTVGIFAGDEPVRFLHMLDSNGCEDTNDPEIIRYAGVYDDQLCDIKTKAENSEKKYGRKVPSFAAFHIPVKAFELAEISAGYKTEERNKYAIGVDVKARNGDFGCNYSGFTPAYSSENFVETLKEMGTEAVFVGHNHSINTCIMYEGIRWVFGLKTGQYDSHVAYQLGGTLVRVNGEKTDIHHIPALVAMAPFPLDMRVFKGFFAEDKTVLCDNEKYKK